MMKTFAYVCVLLSSFQIIRASTSELEAYQTINSEMEKRIENLLGFSEIAGAKGRSMTSAFYRAIGNVRLKYGEDISLKFQQKYEAKAADFAARPQSSKDCAEYIVRLLAEHKLHQEQLLDYISKATVSHATANFQVQGRIYMLTEHIKKVRTEKDNCEIKAGDDSSLLLDCATEALAGVQELEASMPTIMYQDAKRMAADLYYAMVDLRQSIRDRQIPEFYDEDGIDHWLELYCSERPGRTPR